jgi:hypothetical protein
MYESILNELLGMMKADTFSTMPTSVWLEHLEKRIAEEQDLMAYFYNKENL